MSNASQYDIKLPNRFAHTWLVNSNRQFYIHLVATAVRTRMTNHLFRAQFAKYLNGLLFSTMTTESKARDDYGRNYIDLVTKTRHHKVIWNTGKITDYYVDNFRFGVLVQNLILYYHVNRSPIRQQSQPKILLPISNFESHHHCNRHRLVV